MVDTNGVPEIKDFTLKDRPKVRKFKIDEDVFDAVSTIPLGLLHELVKVGDLSGLKTEEIAERISQVLKPLLLPTAFERFVTRLTDRENPIGHEHVVPLVKWLVEGYTIRPTQPSPSSSAGSPTAEESTSLTAGAPDIQWPGLTSTPATAST